MCITFLQSCLFLSLKRCANYELLSSSDSTVKLHILLKACMKPCSRSQNSDQILLKYCSHCGEVKPRTSRAVRPHLQGSRNIIGSRILATTYRGFPSRVSFSFFDSQTSNHHSRHLVMSGGCPCVRVSSSWKQTLDYLESLSVAATMKLLRDFHYGTKNERTHVCRSHLQTLEQRLRLMTKQLTEKILLKRIKITYEYRFHLEHLKINTTSMKWFHQDSRFFHLIDSLQLFQLQSMMMNKSRVDTSMFCKKFIEKMKYQKWKKNDSIILLSIFDWIMKESSWRLIKNKLNMYMWHQRNDLNITRHDWLRIFMYIMLQQLIRQNLLYYVIIMTLRSNHEINLIAFSYYIKCMLKNYFVIVKHLDVNVFDLLSDRT